MRIPATATLITPCVDLEREFLALYEDYQKAGEQEWCDAAKGAPIDFPDYVRTLRDEADGKGISADWAPTSHFWLIAEARLIGTLRIRHYLTLAVEERAGHIGYDIAPSSRGLGYGHYLLAEALNQARKLGIQDVLAICDARNTPSKRILEKGGGVIAKTKNGEIWYLFKSEIQPLRQSSL